MYQESVEINLIVVTGPSGCGKSTLLKRLLDEYPDLFAFSVSHTTRHPRQNERDGVDYHFVDREWMQAAIERGEFLEYTEFDKNLYGTSRQAVMDVQKTGKGCILDVDMRGVKLIKKSGLRAVYVLIAPPSIATLEKRLRCRGTESDSSISRRVDQAILDLDEADNADMFDCRIVNSELRDAYRDLQEFLSTVKLVFLKQRPFHMRFALHLPPRWDRNEAPASK